MSEEVMKRDDFTPFLLFDRLDDKLIREELEGKMPEILTYHFRSGGQEVWGISKAGVDEAKSELAKKGEVVRELEVSFQDSPEEAYFNVKAGRYVVSKEGKEILLDTAFGFKRQPKKYENGNLNPFWYEQGGIKASRNASMRLIPKSIQAAVIEFAKQKGKVKTVESPYPEEGKKEPPKEASPTKKSAHEGTYVGNLLSVQEKESKDGRPYWTIKHACNDSAAWTYDPDISKLAMDATKVNASMEWQLSSKGQMLNLKVAQIPK